MTFSLTEDLILSGATVKYMLYTNATNGTVEKFPDSTSYTAGDTVMLLAIPDSNSNTFFNSWSGDVLKTKNDSAWVVMDSSKSVSADFFCI